MGWLLSDAGFTVARRLASLCFWVGFAAMGAPHVLDMKPPPEWVWKAAIGGFLVTWVWMAAYLIRKNLLRAGEEDPGSDELN